MSQIELLLLGTGTSAGIPIIGCHCDVCSSDDPRDRRTRPSAVISYNGRRILVDAAPELRLQCVTHGVDMIDAIVFTHAHADHIMGLDDVRRFNALSGGSLDVWADPRTHTALSRCFGYAFEPRQAVEKVFRPLLNRCVIQGPFNIDGMIWTPVPLFHGDDPILGFRVGRLAYCTDVSLIPDESWSLLEDLDVLVLDALQYKKHATHFNLEQAIEAAQRINARLTLFTHIAHALKHEQVNRTLPANMRLGHDGERAVARG